MLSKKKKTKYHINDKKILIGLPFKLLGTLIYGNTFYGERVNRGKLVQKIKFFFSLLGRLDKF